MNTDTYYSFRFFLQSLIFLGSIIVFTSPIFSNNHCWQLTCPEDINVQLEPGECNMAVVFDTAAWSSTEQLVDTIFFPPSGSFFGVGTIQVTLATTTVSGDLEVCTFNIVVQDFQPATLDCEQNLTIDLNGSCEREFLPSELLDLDSAGCINNYQAFRLSASGDVEPPIISASDIGQTFLAVVQHSTNNMQCLTQVTVSGGTPPSITCPENISVLCNSFLFPSITGFPDTTGCFENLNITYSDVTAATLCTDSIAFQTTRTWAATDPFGNLDVCQQIITGVRFNLDLVKFPPNYDGSELAPLSCQDGVSLQEIIEPVFTGEPTVNNSPADNNIGCDISSNYVDIVTNICGASFDIQRVWTVINLCTPSDIARDTQYIKVVDTMSPIFSIPDTLFASIDMRCYDSLFLPSIENVVECSSFDVEIRTPWDTLYTNGGWTPIELMLGEYIIVYKVTDACGHFSFGTSLLSIENENLVACPPSDTITCDYYFSTVAPAIGLNNFALLNELGVPEYHGNCEFTFSETDSVSINGCGVGTIFRMLKTDSINVGDCVQEIYVEHVSNFTAVFPKDTSICTDPTTVNLGAPVLIGVSCENMSTNFTDEIISGSVIDCYTLKRTWTITNACSYANVNTGDDTQFGDFRFTDGGDGIIEYVQLIEVNDTDGPTFNTDCGFPNLYIFPNDCEITVTVPTPDVTGCGDVQLSFSGDLGTQMGVNVKLNPGEYSMTFTAVDECGKVTKCEDSFMVIDSIAPVAICKQNVITELFPVDPPDVQVWAVDFNDGSFDNCGGNLNYHFLLDSLSLGAVFGCCDVGLHPLTLVVTDEYGNQSTCLTSVTVQANNVGCDDCNPSISGFIFTEEMIGINNVDLTIDPSSGNSIIIGTDTSGTFDLHVEPGLDYTIVPSKNNNHLNGVTTFDAVKMTRHILNVELLDSPYKMIAADINNSKSITTFDIVVLRKLILNIYTNYPNNTSWRFIPADYVFPNPLNPFEENFPEVININNLMESQVGLNFIGVKVGDLNNSADPKD
ncbi:MAG: HYR domain-containing protein [Saprospiraceae bacterium]